MVAQGHSVTVYKRNPVKAKLWVGTYGQSSAPTPAMAGQGALVVMACVGNHEGQRAVCFGEDGTCAGMTAGAVFVDHTTVPAEVACEDIQRKGGQRNDTSSLIRRLK